VKNGRTSETTYKKHSCCFQLLADAEEARAEAERAQTQILQWQKKQEAHEQVLNDWRRQCDELSIQIERTQEECRRSVADVRGGLA
jgi:chromosome segregation ATPase